MLVSPGAPPVEVRDGARSPSAAARSCAGSTSPSASGEFLALMGANGSGKSTLVRAMTGLLPLTRAAASALFGTPFADFRDWKRVGFVPQRASAASGVPATVWEVVASGRISRRRPLLPLSREPTAGRSTHAIDVVGLSDRTGLRRLPAERRAAAARPDRSRAGRRARPAGARRAHRRRRPAQPAAPSPTRSPRSRPAARTIVLVAHELGPMAPLIDRAVVMRDGRIAYDGPRSTRRTPTGTTTRWPRRTTTSRTWDRRSTSWGADDERLRRPLLAALHAARAARRPADRASPRRRSAPSSCSAASPCWATASATSPSPVSRSACSPAPRRRGPPSSSRSSAPC